MHHTDRPAVLPALSLLAGGWWASAPEIGSLWFGAMGLAAYTLRRHGRSWFGLALSSLLLLAMGFGVVHVDERQARARESTWWQGTDERIEGSFRAEVLGAAERDGHGERLLRVRLYRLEEPERRDRAVAVRLRVAASPAEPTARLDGLRAGDRVRVWARVVRAGEGTPGASDRRRSLRAQDLAGHAFVKSARLIELLERGPAGISRLLDELKVEARARLDRGVGTTHPAHGLVAAMVLGDRGGLSSSDLWALRRAGLMHLVAVSGLHVTLLLAMTLALLGRRPPSRIVALGLTLTGLAAFALFVGPRASVLRAVAGASVVLIGRRLGRDGDALNSLAWIGAAMFVTWPPVLHDAGFQLSFAATAAILGLARSLGARLPGPAFLRLPLAMSTAAYVATAPICAAWFQSIAPASLLSNLIAVPLCAICLGAGYLALLFEPLPWIGWIAAKLCSLAGQGIIVWADHVAAWPHGAQRVGAPGRWMVAAMLTLVFWRCVAASSCRTQRRWLATALALALVAIHVGPAPRDGDGRTEIIVLDVGQGQSVALLGPRGGVVLVDAGGSVHPRFDPGERIVAPEVAAWNRGRIDVLVISHGHIDHVGGAAALLRELDVGELWLPPGSTGHSRLADLAALARDRGTAVVVARAGLRERRAEVPLRVLAPERRAANRHWGVNDGSVVILAGSRPHRVLIPGDIEAAAERALIQSGRALAAEVLVVPHHGSRSSSSAAWLHRVRPEWALISAGRWNRFGHPHAEVLERLAAVGTGVRRTDIEGHLRLRANARGWHVVPAESEQPQRHGDERHDEHQQQ